MELIVELANKTTRNFPGLWKYQTDNGELDILSDDFPIATFAKDQWIMIRRFKDDDEEWPVESEQTRTGDGLLDGIPHPKFDYQPPYPTGRKSPF